MSVYTYTENDTRNIVNALRTDESLAQWKAAAAFLSLNNDDPLAAEKAVADAVGHGLLAVEADLLTTLVWALASESAQR